MQLEGLGARPGRQVAKSAFIATCERQCGPDHLDGWRRSSRGLEPQAQLGNQIGGLARIIRAVARRSPLAALGWLAHAGRLAWGLASRESERFGKRPIQFASDKIPKEMPLYEF